MTLLFLILWTSIISYGNCAKILGIISFPSYSHQIVFQPLWRELSLRGHQVTTLTTDPINNPHLTNLTEIDLHFSYEAWRSLLDKVIDATQSNLIRANQAISSAMQDFTKLQLEHPQVESLIRSDATFDLLIVEYFMPSMFAFSHRFNCPMIGVISMDAPNNVLKTIGNPNHPILYPDPLLPFADVSTLFMRLKSVAVSLFLEYYYNHHFYTMQQKHVQTFFGANYPSLAEIARNTSLLFINTDPIFHKVKPFLPNVIQIGGGSYRIPSAPLPDDLQTMLDSATEGVIYFSLGSNVNSDNLAVDTRNMILEVFAELPYKVLWKFESEHIPNMPENVYVSKWFPQVNILKHPNVKLFITQGGLQSIDEAIHSCVPIVVMPFFGDQFSNTQRMVSRGVGLSLDYTNLVKEEFKTVIMEVITNPRYKIKMIELAELVSDQPMTGLERAVWWTEYVIRHKGAKHLRSPFLDMPSYQYYMIDVISVLALFFSLLSIIAYIIFRGVYVMAKRVCFGKRVRKVKKQ